MAAVIGQTSGTLPGGIRAKRVSRHEMAQVLRLCRNFAHHLVKVIMHRLSTGLYNLPVGGQVR